ncbi:hypothetical protein [Neptunomonas phycophila]|uniref:hypothetical protein n=1 Tax=Neptunomonas phycophila TaxID=1572645 RepID=UPI001BEB13F1|nr:hypothetical protein [Neptunomonas phycophila]MBT3144869.1 hypothetical protein [Neptunomonas phycophila]
MTRFCVFCGDKPEGKTKEHVIPQWLIGMTGNPKREGNFGFKKTGNGAELRKFAFDQFTFPACDSCNNEYSTLEANAKPIIERILNDGRVTAKEMALFLDWLDKVRVGIWLGLILLDKTHLDENVLARVEPQFHIKKRIGQFDRLLIVEKFESKMTRLSIGGVDSFAFRTTPSAFKLTINNVCFTNISSMFLVSHRLGFPYPSKLFLSQNREELGVKLEDGTCRIKSPVLRKNIKEKGVMYVQPMFPNLLTDSKLDEYDSEYVKAHSLDYEAGAGNIFEQLSCGVKEYSGDELIFPTCQVQANENSFQIRSLVNIYEWQNWILDNFSPDVSDLTEDQKRFIKSRFKSATKINNMFISHYNAML